MAPGGVPRQPVRLPLPVRNATLGALLLAGVVGFGAASEMQLLLHLSESPERFTSAFGDPALAKAIWERQVRALQGMRASRFAINGGLAIACALVFVAAARLLRPFGLRREQVRRLLAASALTAAVLRTLDGAQGAAVMRKVGGAAAEALARSQPEGFLGPVFPLLFTAASVGLTALVAGSFAALSVYFKSEKVKQIVTLAD